MKAFIAFLISFNLYAQYGANQGGYGDPSQQRQQGMINTNSQYHKNNAGVLDALKKAYQGQGKQIDIKQMPNRQNNDPNNPNNPMGDQQGGYGGGY